MGPERTSITVRSSGRPYEREILQVRIPGPHERGISSNGRTVEITNDSSASSRDVKIKMPFSAPTATPSTVRLPDAPAPAPFAVDREKNCPLLLRVFCNVGRHFSMAEFQHGNVPSGELQIYTWMDATLKELTTLIRDVHPDARLRGTYFEFNMVFPDNRSSGYRCRNIGTTRNGERGQEDNRMLNDVRFQIGNFMSVAITPPERPF